MSHKGSVSHTRMAHMQRPVWGEGRRDASAFCTLLSRTVTAKKVNPKFNRHYFRSWVPLNTVWDVEVFVLLCAHLFSWSQHSLCKDASGHHFTFSAGGSHLLPGPTPQWVNFCCSFKEKSVSAPSGSSLRPRHLSDLFTARLSLLLSSLGDRIPNS